MLGSLYTNFPFINIGFCSSTNSKSLIIVFLVISLIQTIVKLLLGKFLLYSEITSAKAYPVTLSYNLYSFLYPGFTIFNVSLLNLILGTNVPFSVIATYL